MHMSDALLSLPVAGAFWVGTAVTLGLAARHVSKQADSSLAPRMGVLAAFVFAAQMINFTLPGTGSSGHFAGGTLLALMLGPWAAMICIASVLAIQALFFADGGLLALGANIFNMGLIPAFIVLPLVYRPLAGSEPSRQRQRLAIIASTVAACALGALAVTLQTTASGITELPFGRFAMIMVPVHIAIGLVEGLITLTVLEQVQARQSAPVLQAPWQARTLGALGVAALLVAGTLSWFASTHPDGLEFSMAALKAEPQAAEASLHSRIAAWQADHALYPDYAPREAEAPRAPETAAEAAPASEPWPAPSAGTSQAGLVGTGLVFAAAIGLGLAFRKRPMAG